MLGKAIIIRNGMKIYIKEMCAVRLVSGHIHRASASKMESGVGSMVRHHHNHFPTPKIIIIIIIIMYIQLYFRNSVHVTH